MNYPGSCGPIEQCPDDQQEHLIHLLLIILSQCFLLSSEPDLELLKLFLMSI